VSDLLVDLAQILAGSLAIAAGIRIRMGGLRSRVLLYRDFRLPFFMRNSAFALVPTGMCFLFAGLGELAYAQLQQPLDGLIFALDVLIVAISIPMVIVAAAVAIFWGYRPPDIAKPQWLREEEALHGKPVDPSVWGRRLDSMPILILIAMGAVIVIIAVVGITLTLLRLPVP
jgi:hypothetical protein